MLQFRRITIKNFVCFDRIEIEPSADARKPLTVIRAENGSGKTTLLRAIRWGMYGEKALPGNTEAFSLHPASWQPDEEGVTTSVIMQFATDGSSREHWEAGSSNTLFELKRSVRTVKAADPRPGSLDFRRLDQRAYLQERKADGSWKTHDAGPEPVIKELLPWDLRDFFVMDADEAADYVGGSENKVVDRSDAIDKTTHALKDLLGLNIFKDSAEKLEQISNAFGRSATKAIGSYSIKDTQADLDRHRKQLSEIKDRLKKNAVKSADVQERLNRQHDRLESLVGNLAAHDQLKKRMAENRAAQKMAKKYRAEAVTGLQARLFDISLYGALASREVDGVRKLLKPLYDSGSIPVRHLDYVQGLLDRGECICGQALDADSAFGHRVRENLSLSSEQKEKADWLSSVLEAADNLHLYQGGGEWDEACVKHEKEIASLDSDLGELAAVKREIESKLDQVQEGQVQNARNEIQMLKTSYESIHKHILEDKQEESALQKKVNELDGKVRGQQARAREAKEHLENQRIGELLIKIIKAAYTSMSSSQVAELDKRMDRLFHQMAANVTDDDVHDGDKRKAPLAMIERVGLRSVDGDDDKYEIYALNSRDRMMPPTEINGASRRILALSFVLALCRESNTHAPLVADSLLNFMSGAVRTNTLRITAQTASQPILLLTGSDLESDEEAALVAEYAAATYTLTGQWQHKEEGGDVLRITDRRKVSLLCDCGPREYCDICEREGQSLKIGWSRRLNGSN